MYVKEHPRLIDEILRGSKRYNLIKKTRSVSDRADSTMKEDLKILKNPGSSTLKGLLSWLKLRPWYCCSTVL
jgi:hypothetical protein